MRRLLPIIMFLVLACNARSQWLQDSIINDRNTKNRTGYSNARGIVSYGDSLYAVWTEQGHRIFLRAKQSGAWLPSEEVSVGSPGGIYGLSANPSIAVRSGDIHVVWEDYRTGDFEIFYRRFSGGWGNPVNLSGDPDQSRSPVLAVTTNGNIVLTWQDDRTGIYEIYSKIYEGGNWGATEKRSSTTFYAGFPTTAHYGETVYIVWEEMENNGYELYGSIYTGGSWTTPQKITHSEGMSHYPSLCIDPNGTPHLVWMDDRDNNFVIYYSHFNGTNWSIPVPASNNPGEALYPQIVSDPFGVLHLAWSDDREGNYEIFYKKNVSGTWSGDTALSHGERLSTSPQLAASTDGSVHVMWYDCMEDSNKVSPHIRHKRFNAVSDMLSMGITPEIFSHGVTFTASISYAEPHLFRIDSPYPVHITQTLCHNNTYTWHELLQSGDYTYVLQTIAGTDVHYSHPVQITIPQKNAVFSFSVSPNPFRDKINIEYCIGQSAEGIELEVFDVAGRLVKNFILYPSPRAIGKSSTYSGITQGESFILPAKLEWDGKNNHGKEVPSGIYFFKVNTYTPITGTAIKL